MITTTTTTTYPRLPELAPRAPGESAECYGLRALLFVTAERQTATVDLEGLQLAAHAYRLAVCNRELSPAGAERLADVNRLILAGLARRAAETAPETAHAPLGDAIAPPADRQGPGAPLRPAPVTPRPPAGGLTVDAPRPAAQAPAPVWLPPVAPASRLAAEDLF